MEQRLIIMLVRYATRDLKPMNKYTHAMYMMAARVFGHTMSTSMDSWAQTRRGKERKNNTRRLNRMI